MKSKTVTICAFKVHDERDEEVPVGERSGIPNDKQTVVQFMADTQFSIDNKTYPLVDLASPNVIADLLFKYGRIKIETADQSKIFLLTLTHDTDK